jgi:hypothetical protein
MRREKVKKFVQFLFVIFLLLVGLGFGAYYFGANLASEKLMDTVSSELEHSGKIEQVKQYVENDPELKKNLEEAATVKQDQLPFTTKEEATRVLIKRVGVSELMDIQTQVQEGTITKDELLQKAQEKLTEQEILALKVIAYRELYK